jgi:hypothetical protein
MQPGIAASIANSALLLAGRDGFKSETLDQSRGEPMQLGRRGLSNHAVMGLAAGLLGADRALASPYYTVQDL